jgi:hypothetical protein
MSADIGMAFVIALLIRMFAMANKYLKYIVVSTVCISFISIYFRNGCEIGFIGEMDLAIWIVFIILFHILLDLLEIGVTSVLKRAIKDEIKK